MMPTTTTKIMTNSMIMTTDNDDEQYDDDKDDDDDDEQYDDDDEDDLVDGRDNYEKIFCLSLCTLIQGQTNLTVWKKRKFRRQCWKRMQMRRSRFFHPTFFICSNLSSQ